MQMPQLARIFFIAFASFAASCSAEQAQLESERKDDQPPLSGPGGMLV
jgi:hypothetical protein